jgi:hypothetical protein
MWVTIRSFLVGVDTVSHSIWQELETNLRLVICHLSYYMWSPKFLCYRLGEWAYQYLLCVQFFPFHQLVPVYYEAWGSFSCNTVLDSPFKFQVLTFYYTEHLFQHIVLSCPPLFCGMMLRFFIFQHFVRLIYCLNNIFPSWSEIVCCCLLIVSIRGLTRLSTHVCMLASIT